MSDSTPPQPHDGERPGQSPNPAAAGSADPSLTPPPAASPVPPPPAGYAPPTSYAAPPAGGYAAPAYPPPAYGSPATPNPSAPGSAAPGGYGQPPAYRAPGYGAPAAYGYGAYAPRTNPLAVASMVSSIVGVALSWTWVLALGVVVGVILGHIALGQIKRTGEKGRGMALAGVIIGWISIGFTALLILSFALFFTTGMIGDYASA